MLEVTPQRRTDRNDTWEQKQLSALQVVSFRCSGKETYTKQLFPHM